MVRANVKISTQPVVGPSGKASPVPATSLLLIECPECAGMRRFEVPPCADEHGDCPEVICVDCGSALLLAVTLAEQPDLLPLARTA